MFQWPQFCAVLSSGGTPAERFGRLLDHLDSLPDSEAVLSALFEDRALITRLAALAPLVHHMGFLAPAGLSAASVEEQCHASAYAANVRSFESEVWAREISNRFGRPVEVTIVQAFRDDPARYGVEVFVATLPDHEIDSLVADEAGCHVALAIRPGGSFDDAFELLHAHHLYEQVEIQSGPAFNEAIGAQVLYIDVPSPARSRRLELLSTGDGS